MLDLYMSLEVQATAAKTQSCKSSWGIRTKEASRMNLTKYVSSESKPETLNTEAQKLSQTLA